MRLYGFIAAMLFVLGAVVGFLAPPDGLYKTRPPAPSYQVTARAYDQLVAGITATAILPDLGLDLSRGDRLSYLVMIKQFLPENSTGFDQLDPAVQDCLAARDRCTGYAFKVAGNPNARAVVVIQSGHVVYKSMTGRLMASAQPQ